jgi:hypothetical protein
MIVKRRYNLILNLIIGIFSAVLIFAIILYISKGLTWNLLWICYPAITLITIGIFFKKSNLILSQVVILFVPDSLWIFDFIIKLVTGKSPLGMTNYFFNNPFSLSNILTLHHFFIVPLSILALFILKVKRNDKVFGLVLLELLFFFILSYLIPQNSGINCLPISTICTSLKFPKTIPYPLIWGAVEVIFTFLSYYLLISLPFLKKK